MDPIIKTEHLSCQMGQSYLIKDINWEVLAGEKWVVYGLNGSGKTTLLSIIAGYKSHSAGKLTVFGSAYNQENVLEKRKRIGWVSSSFYDKFYTKESVLDIILSGKFGTLGINHGVQLSDIALIKRLLAELGMGDKVNHSFDTLSKGQRQNVMIARALLADPEILILDEPCTGLDVYNRAYLFSTIQALSARKNLTIIYVTHYTEEILDLFDHGLLLRQGEVFAVGKTKSLFIQDKLNHFFGYDVEVHREHDGFYKLSVTADSRMADILGGE